MLVSTFKTEKFLSFKLDLRLAVWYCLKLWWCIHESHCVLQLFALVYEQEVVDGCNLGEGWHRASQCLWRLSHRQVWGWGGRRQVASNFFRVGSNTFRDKVLNVDHAIDVLESFLGTVSFACKFGYSIQGFVTSPAMIGLFYTLRGYKVVLKGLVNLRISVCDELATPNFPVRSFLFIYEEIRNFSWILLALYGLASTFSSFFSLKSDPLYFA